MKKSVHCFRCLLLGIAFCLSFSLSARERGGEQNFRQSSRNQSVNKSAVQGYSNRNNANKTYINPNYHPYVNPYGNNNGGGGGTAVYPYPYQTTPGSSPGMGDDSNALYHSQLKSPGQSY